MLPHNAIACIEEAPRNTLRVCTSSGDILLRFRSEEELRAWKCELDAMLKPVVCIGTMAFHEQPLQATRDADADADFHYSFLDHPYSMQSRYESAAYEEATPPRQMTDPTVRRESLASLPFSDATTFVAGSSLSGSKQSRHTSRLSGSTDRKSTRLNSSHSGESRMPSSA